MTFSSFRYPEVKVLFIFSAVIDRHGTIAIIVLGHLVTIPTALAVAEIATNHQSD